MTECPKCNGKKFTTYTDGPEYGEQECDACAGTGQVSLVDWSMLNGWETDSLGGAETECSNGWYQLDVDNNLYFIDRDFERFHLAKIKRIEQLLTHIASHHDN